MGCNGSKSVTAIVTEGATPADKDNTDATNDASTRPVTPQPVPPSMAFDIPFIDESEESADSSIVKKHPPKRLQRLEEQQQNTVPVSLVELNEKQQEAENRRLQFLQMRAQSAKRKYAMRNVNNNSNEDQNTDDFNKNEIENYIEVTGDHEIEEDTTVK